MMVERVAVARRRRFAGEPSLSHCCEQPFVDIALAISAHVSGGEVEPLAVDGPPLTRAEVVKLLSTNGCSQVAGAPCIVKRSIRKSHFGIRPSLDPARKEAGRRGNNSITLYLSPVGGVSQSVRKSIGHFCSRSSSRESVGWISTPFLSGVRPAGRT